MEIIKVKLCEEVVSCKCPICGALASCVFNDKINSECGHLRNVRMGMTEAEFHFDYQEKTIFKYRELQHIIDRLPQKKIKKDAVRRLNSGDPKDVHSVEWELILMDWFNKFGKVDYEIMQPNGKKPDITFTSCKPFVKFISDVASVSDLSVEKTYQASRLCAEAEKILRAAVNNNFSFHIDLKSSSKNNLKMFASSRIDQNLEKFRKWVEQNINNISLGGKLSYYMEDNELKIHILPKQDIITASYPKRVYTPEQEYSNPVYNILDSKSSKQLQQSSDKLVGIFLCDSGCMLLNSYWRAHNEIKVETILSDILCKYSNLDFIIMFSIYETSNRPYIAINAKYNENNLPNKDFLILSNLIDKNKESLQKPNLFPKKSSDLITNKKCNSNFWTFHLRTP